MHLDLVIPTKNKEARLDLTLSCLAAQDCGANWRLYLVEDGSDGSCERARSAWSSELDVTIVPGPKRGRAAARNAGARAGSGELILFMDDDILSMTNMLQAHIEAHEQTPGLFAHAPLWEIYGALRLDNPAQGIPGLSSSEANTLSLTGYDPRDRNLHRNALERTVSAIFENGMNDLIWLSAIGANLSVERSIFQGVGGFDEKFGTAWGCEDLELGVRLDESGARGHLLTATRGAHLSHWRPEAQTDHYATHKHFRELHDRPDVTYLPLLLSANGRPDYYFRALGRHSTTP